MQCTPHTERTSRATNQKIGNIPVIVLLSLSSMPSLISTSRWPSKSISSETSQTTPSLASSDYVNTIRGGFHLVTLLTGQVISIIYL